MTFGQVFIQEHKATININNIYKSTSFNSKHLKCIAQKNNFDKKKNRKEELVLRKNYIHLDPLPCLHFSGRNTNSTYL